MDFLFCQDDLVDIIYIRFIAGYTTSKDCSHDQKSCCSQDLRREYLICFSPLCMVFFFLFFFFFSFIEVF